MSTRKKPSQVKAAKKPEEPVVSPDTTPETPTLQNKPTKRRRLAKAFTYPLDEILENRTKPVRERFTILQGEYEQLVEMKKNLSAQGLDAKKSDLVRIGLGLLFRQSEEDIQALLQSLPRAS